MAYARLTAFCFQVSSDLISAQPATFVFALVCMIVVTLTLLCREFYFVLLLLNNRLTRYAPPTAV